MAWGTTLQEDEWLLSNLSRVTSSARVSSNTSGDGPNSSGPIMPIAEDSSISPQTWRLLASRTFGGLESLLRRPEVDEYAWTVGDSNVIDIPRDTLVVKSDDTRTKLAFSFGLAASVKLSVVRD